MLSTVLPPSCTLHRRGYHSWDNKPLFFQFFRLLSLLPLALHLGPLAPHSKSWQEKHDAYAPILVTLARAVLVVTHALHEVVHRIVTTTQVATVVAQREGAKVGRNSHPVCVLTLVIRCHFSFTIQTTCLHWCEDQRCRRREALRTGGNRRRGVFRAGGTPEYLPFWRF